MDRVPVYILAGGKSSRFGRDKARELLDGVPLIVNLARAVYSVAASITVVAGEPEKYADLGLHTIADPVPALGPLGGLLAALEDCSPDEWLLLLSCDFVGVRTEWIHSLLAHRRDGAHAVVYQDSAGWEPLMALYHPAIRPAAERHIAERNLPMWALVEAVERVAVPVPANWSELSNVNVPEDLIRCNGGVREHGSSDTR